MSNLLCTILYQSERSVNTNGIWSNRYVYTIHKRHSNTSGDTILLAEAAPSLTRRLTRSLCHCSPLCFTDCLSLIKKGRFYQNSVWLQSPVFIIYTLFIP